MSALVFRFTEFAQGQEKGRCAIEKKKSTAAHKPAGVKGGYNRRSDRDRARKRSLNLSNVQC